VGTTGDVPVPARYTNSTRDDIATFRPSTGTWYIRNVAPIRFGQNGDMPTPGNWGDNHQIAVFRPSQGKWYIRGVPAVSFGTSGDIPV
jgi:hypothetical protein